MFLNTSHMCGFNEKKMKNVFLNVLLYRVLHTINCVNIQVKAEVQYLAVRKRRVLPFLCICVCVCIYKCIQMYLYIHTQIL